MQLHREHEFAAEQIDTAQIELADQSMYTERPIDIDNADRILCASHPRYVAACALIDRQIDLERFRNHRLKDPKLFDLVARMSTHENPRFTERYGREGRPTRITVRLRDGRELSCEVNHAPGGPGNPMSDDQLIEKFIRYAAPAAEPERCRRFVDNLFRLEQIEQIDRLTALLRYDGRAPASAPQSTPTASS
jgi:2-methylcitrate dehydratase PrpD